MLLSIVANHFVELIIRLANRLQLGTSNPKTQQIIRFAWKQMNFQPGFLPRPFPGRMHANFQSKYSKTLGTWELFN